MCNTHSNCGRTGNRCQSNMQHCKSYTGPFIRNIYKKINLMSEKHTGTQRRDRDINNVTNLTFSSYCKYFTNNPSCKCTNETEFMTTGIQSYSSRIYSQKLFGNEYMKR